MSPTARSLTGSVLGISISAPDVMPPLGLIGDDLDAITLELCERLVSLGASVVLGHQWRPQGIMERVTRFARGYVREPDRSGPIVHNFLAWPDRAALAESERLQLESSGLVAIWEQSEQDGQGNRTLALTRMREVMTRTTHARLCLGGPLNTRGKDEGWIPGVLEEAALSAQAGQPIYCSALLGGASSLLADLILDPHSFVERMRAAGLDPDSSTRVVGALRVVRDRASQLLQSSGLTAEEYDTLRRAQNLDTVIHATARGLSNSRRAHR